MPNRPCWEGSGIGVPKKPQGSLSLVVLEQVRDPNLGIDGPRLHREAAIEANRGVSSVVSSWYGNFGIYGTDLVGPLPESVGTQWALGPGHPLVANPMAELGVLLGQLGRLEEAEAHLQQALEIWNVRPGPEHPGRPGDIGA